jgi:hypothetical protein
MNRMHRRTFVKLASVGAFATAAPGLGERAWSANIGVPTSALDFMTPAQRDNVLSGAGADVGPRVQQAINEAHSSKRELVFPAGVYRITDPLLFESSFMRVRGEGQAIIHQVGVSGPIIKIGHRDSSTRTEALSFENLVLKGHVTQKTATTNALEITWTHRSTFTDIRVIDCVQSAFLFNRVVSNEFRNLKCSNNVDSKFNLSPRYGIRIIGNSTANVFVNPVMEAPIKSTAIFLEDGDLNLFSGGCVEGVPTGVVIDTASANNTFVNFDFEQNTACDLAIRGGSNNTFTGCWAGSTAAQCVIINSGASGNTFIGGKYRKVVLDTSTNTRFFGADIEQGISGSGKYAVY